MTGPEHYAEAERLLAQYDESVAELKKSGGAFRGIPHVLAAAHVHAMLALADAEVHATFALAGLREER